MATDLDTLSSLLGQTWWKAPVFYSHQFALRFEHGQGEFWLDRFVSAKQRASSIAATALDGVAEIRLVIVRPHDGTALPAEDLARLKNDLAEYELPSIDTFKSQILPSPDTEFDSTWLGVTEIPRHLVDRAIWAAVAIDFGYLPATPGRLYIVNLANGLLIHPYDDRGMDVVAPSPEVLDDLYHRFSDWLLDYDRQRMDKMFSA